MRADRRPRSVTFFIRLGGLFAIGLREYGKFLTGLPIAQTPGVVRGGDGQLRNPEVPAAHIPLDAVERALWEQLRDLGHGR